MNEPIHVNDQNFEQTVLKSPIPVMVDFWAPWCIPCKMLAPSLETLAKEYAGRLLVAKVNTDEDSEWAMRYGVQGIPTVLFVSEGKVVHTQVGMVPLPALRQIVDKLFSTAEAPAKTA